LLKKMKKKKI